MAVSGMLPLFIPRSSLHVAINAKQRYIRQCTHSDDHYTQTVIIIITTVHHQSSQCMITELDLLGRAKGHFYFRGSPIVYTVATSSRFFSRATSRTSSRKVENETTELSHYLIIGQ